MIGASRIADRLLAESTARGPDADRVDQVLVELVNPVLDWAAE